MLKMKVTERSSIPLSASTCNHSQNKLVGTLWLKSWIRHKIYLQPKVKRKNSTTSRVEKITPGDVSFIVAPTPNRVIKTRRDARPKSEIKKR